MVSSAQSLRGILEVFNHTVLHCPQYIDVGVFHPGSLFLLDAVNTRNAAEEVFAYEYFRAIPRVAVTTGRGGNTLVRSYDILKQEIVVRCAGSKCSANGDLFTSFGDFGGYRMRISTMPYSPNVLEGDGHWNEGSGDYWGYEMDMIKEMRRASDINFKPGLLKHEL